MLGRTCNLLIQNNESEIWLLGFQGFVQHLPSKRFHMYTWVANQFDFTSSLNESTLCGSHWFGVSMKVDMCFMRISLKKNSKKQVHCGIVLSVQEVPSFQDSNGSSSIFDFLEFFFFFFFYRVSFFFKLPTVSRQWVKNMVFVWIT